MYKIKLDFAPKYGWVFYKSEVIGYALLILLVGAVIGYNLTMHFYRCLG